MALVLPCAVGEPDLDKVGALSEQEGVEHHLGSVAINSEGLQPHVNPPTSDVAGGENRFFWGRYGPHHGRSSCPVRSVTDDEAFKRPGECECNAIVGQT